MIDPTRFRHKDLRALFEGRPNGIDARWRRKLERMLAQMNVCVSPKELMHYRCHELSGDRKGWFAMRVSPNWRLTFRWDDQGPYDIDLEDYHGR